MEVDDKINSDENLDQNVDEFCPKSKTFPRIACNHENMAICWANKLQPYDIRYFYKKVHKFEPGIEQIKFLSNFLKCYDTKGVRMKCLYYVLRQNGEMVRVCMKTFRSITKISKTVIRSVHNNSERTLFENGFNDSVLLQQSNNKLRKLTINRKWFVLFQRNPEHKTTVKFEVNKLVYPCLACLDIFNQRQYLLNHLCRRSYIIKYRCFFCEGNVCAKFFNSCQFLLHIRGHMIKQEIDDYMIDLNSVDISSLTIEMIDSGENFGVFAEFENINCTKFVRVSQMAQYANIEKSNIFIEIIDIIAITYTQNETWSRLSYFKFKETTKLPCEIMEASKNQGSHKEAFDDWKKLQSNKIVEHKVSIFNTKKLTYLINRDNDTTSKKCSSSTDSAEEGEEEKLSMEMKSPTQYSESEEDNASNCDLEPENCTECAVKLNDLQYHFSIQNSKVKSLKYCETCSWFTINECSYSAHLRYHKQQKPYTCPMCGKVFANMDSFNYHLTYDCLHLIKKLRIKCLSHDCRKFFGSIATLKSHFWSEHVVVVTYLCEEKCKKAYLSKSDHPAECEGQLQSMHHCSLCSPAIKTKDLMTHCNAHFQPHLIDYMFVYFCDNCNVAFLKEKNYFAHREKCSSGDVREHLIQSITPIKFAPITNNKIDNQIINENEVEVKIKEIDEPVIKVRKVAKTCTVCNKEIDNSHRKNFIEHIKSHRQSSTMYQCMECGECFAVKPSLEKHLKIVHDILDVEEYISENDCFDKEAIEKSLELVKYAPGECKEPLEPNQCSVCKLILPNEDLFQTHIRKHGLMFLRHLK